MLFNKYLEDTLENYGIINNMDTIYARLCRILSKTEIQDKDVDMLFQNVTQRFYRKDFSGIDDYVIDETQPSECNFKILECSYPYLSYNICFSFIASYRGDEVWYGAFVGRLEDLYYEIEQKFKLRANSDYKENIQKRIFPISNKSCKSYSKENENYKFLKTLYESLFDSERWETYDEGGCPIYPRLEAFLNATCKMALHLLEQEDSERYILENNDKTRVLFDSRLLTVYGTRLYLSYEKQKYVIPDSAKNEVGCRLINPIIIYSYKTASSLGFSNNYDKIESFPFWVDPASLIFNGRFEDFNLNDISHFDHIALERKDRLPEYLSSLSSIDLLYKIKSSVEHAVRMSKLDYTYIRPMYNLRTYEINFLIPLFSDFKNSRPDCAIVVNKYIDHWIIYTVLDMESAYNNARLISLPNASWLID